MLNSRASIRHDRHALGGTVLKDGVPQADVLVVIFHRNKLEVFAVTRTKPDGTWRINGLAEQPEKSLFGIALPPNVTYNAEIADWLSQAAPNPPPLVEAVTE